MLFFIMDQYTATSSPVAIETASRRDINISMSGSSSSKNMIAPEERSQCSGKTALNFGSIRRSIFSYYLSAIMYLLEEYKVWHFVRTHKARTVVIAICRNATPFYIAYTVSLLWALLAGLGYMYTVADGGSVVSLCTVH